VLAKELRFAAVGHHHRLSGDFMKANILHQTTWQLSLSASLCFKAAASCRSETIGREKPFKDVSK